MTADSPTGLKPSESQADNEADPEETPSSSKPPKSPRPSSGLRLPGAGASTSIRRRFSMPGYTRRAAPFDGISEENEDGGSTGSDEGKMAKIEEKDEHHSHHRPTTSASPSDTNLVQPELKEADEHAHVSKPKNNADHQKWKRPRSHSVTINEVKEEFGDEDSAVNSPGSGRKQLPLSFPAAAEDSGILKTGKAKRISISEGDNQNHPPPIGMLDRQVSFEENDRNSPNSSKMASREKLDEPSNSEADRDKEAIDTYYQNNQFTITDTLNSRMRHFNHDRILGFTNSFYWLAHHHKSYGFRHLCMLILVLIYTLFGAVIFYTIESDHEIRTMKERYAALELALERLSTNISKQINDPKVNVDANTMKEMLKLSYTQLLQFESLYSGSTYYKMEDTQKNLKWTFGSAFFFSMNVFTTTGYGSIAPDSILGKSCVIWYGLIFIPLTLVVIRDLGQWALVHLTKLYILIHTKLREAMGYKKKEEDNDELVSLPIKFSLALMFGYQMLTTVFIFEYDRLYGPDHMTFFHSFYFSFISMSTVGLGDIMPTYVTFSPIITIVFFFGMPIMKVVNRVTYIFVENGVFGKRLHFVLISFI
ncbi:hypothetical protein WR25_03387 isoform D [Diploscapter pachys]|uniref:Potassium channel domain-containing protein n=1 Tax=Diploscapter pachys TaxID=2018661 RepID=A0A2A2LLH5_9BILA|nr:hypothetical protein WR25_03387 isoform A [Diploscapter pachys]PAV86933.1 hypothetical protein WR25_03387 isoform B [Diploscapter pachys]PAV86935.1 hypothetical protein WR25_03387 isoform D [Diploscapter pachys]